MAKVTLKRLLAVAEAELGYHEKASNSQLDDKKANAGSSNWNKYARDLANAGYYNGNKNGYEWCDVWVDWCFFEAADRIKADAEYTQCQTGTLGAGCTYSRGYYKAKGRLSKTPMVGDQAFFSSFQNTDVDNADHTGIVTAVSGNAVTVIEGNKSNEVQKNTYHLGDGWLYDFGHPIFDESSVTDTVTKPTESKVVPVAYYVKAGDTLWDIAQAYGTTVTRIAKDNSLSDPGKIFPGQLLIIGKPAEVTTNIPTFSEMFKVGDKVMMDMDASVYGHSYGFQTWVYKSVLYVRAMAEDKILVSTKPEGDVTGWVNKKYLRKI